MATKAEVYRSIREKLEEGGWIQGNLDSRDGYCLIGATFDAILGYGIPELTHTLFELSNVVGSVSVWNDHPTRTKEDVILLLKYAEADDLATWKELYG